MSMSMSMLIERGRRRSRPRSQDFKYFGYSSTGKLHKCLENGQAKCGMGRVLGKTYVSEPSSNYYNRCQRCYRVSKPKKKSVYKDLVDKDVKTWCGRIGIKL